MAAITSIQVSIQTMDTSGAGTDGDVYLGFSGREFYLDTTADDFERGSSRTYRLGDGPNVLFASVNDPRKPQLAVENVDRFPVWIRFVPRGRDDNWILGRAVVTLNDRLFPMWDTAEYISFREGIQLGTHSGLFVHLLRHND
jgi:hypothetical protein